MPRRMIVLAGNFEQYLRWKQLYPHYAQRAIFASGEADLRGRRPEDHDIVRTGNWADNPMFKIRWVQDWVAKANEIAEWDLDSAFEWKIRQSQDRFEGLIEDVTGWRGVEDVARVMVETILRNVGGGGGMPWRTRCGCGNMPFNYEGEWDPLGREQEDATYVEELRKQSKGHLG